MKILEFHCNPNIVTKLDFKFCYWIESKKLRNFAKKCTNLRDLSVAHSNLSNQDLAEILEKNENILKLSFSIETPDTFWFQTDIVSTLQINDINKRKTSAPFSIEWEDLFSLSHFFKCGKRFALLQSLEICMRQSPIILGTILRYI